MKIKCDKEYTVTNIHAFIILSNAFFQDQTFFAPEVTVVHETQFPTLVGGVYIKKRSDNYNNRQHNHHYEKSHEGNTQCKDVLSLGGRHCHRDLQGDKELTTP